MRSDREAKKVLKAFGKEAYKERIKYVDSFLPENTSFIRTISYKHAIKRVAFVALLLILVLALAVSAYAAVVYYLNYTKVIHNDNDEYIYDTSGEYQDENTNGIYFEPTYIPNEYKLSKIDNDELFHEKTWIYENKSGDTLRIFQSLEGTDFHVDNERSVVDIFNVGSIQVTEYKYNDEIVSFMQYKNMVINIQGQLDRYELEKVIEGLHIPE